jgi:hypothetical protein
MNRDKVQRENNKEKINENGNMDILYVSTMRATYFTKHFLTVQAKAKEN